jgi:hypothetical protein
MYDEEEYICMQVLKWVVDMLALELLDPFFQNDLKDVQSKKVLDWEVCKAHEH